MEKPHGAEFGMGDYDSATLIQRASVFEFTILPESFRLREQLRSANGRLSFRAPRNEPVGLVNDCQAAARS